MVQAVDRLVGRRAAAGLAAMLVLGGCQCLWPQAPAEAAGAAASEAPAAAAACPAVLKAKAWVNRMPGIGDSPSKLVVVLDIDSDAPWMLAPAATGNGLALELKPGGNSVPGRVAYRQRQPAALPESVAILCQGGEVARIDEILVVQ